MEPQDLTLVGLTDDGNHLVLVSDTGDEFRLPADKLLRAALRGDHARLGQLEITMESALRPRDIQARIRAGESPESVAAAASTSLDKIMGYATPVLAERAYQSDPAQLRAVDALERCENEWADYKARRSNAVTKLLRAPVPADAGIPPGGSEPVLRRLGDWLVRPPIPRGVYMHGGVGRGKSFLMDCFFQSVPLTRKTRLHFHEFMREVHRELQDLKGTPDPLQELGRRIARRHRLICFDEFHVADVTDAMILHRLLESMFANRVSIVTTSNFHPDELYPNGLHRERILPAIELLKQHLEVVNVDNGTDYRRATLQDLTM